MKRRLPTDGKAGPRMKTANQNTVDSMRNKRVMEKTAQFKVLIEPTF